MDTSDAPEKRRHPRVDRRVQVRTTAGDTPLETINLSAGGLFCSSKVWVAPMTRLALSLQLPLATDAGIAVVEGEAVVVRTEPAAPIAAPATYRIALFFSRMADEDRRTLQTFLTSRAS